MKFFKYPGLKHANTILKEKTPSLHWQKNLIMLLSQDTTICWFRLCAAKIPQLSEHQCSCSKKIFFYKKRKRRNLEKKANCFSAYVYWLKKREIYIDIDPLIQQHKKLKVKLPHVLNVENQHAENKKTNIVNM